MISTSESNKRWDNTSDSPEYRRWEESQNLFLVLQRNPTERRRLRKLTYRCPNNQKCALIEVFVASQGVLVHASAYRHGKDEARYLTPSDHPDLHNRLFTPKCKHNSGEFIITDHRIWQDLNAGRKSVHLTYPQE